MAKAMRAAKLLQLQQEMNIPVKFRGHQSIFFFFWYSFILDQGDDARNHHDARNHATSVARKSI